MKADKLHAPVEPPFSVRQKWAPWLFAGIIALVALDGLILVWHGHATPYNNYVWLADAFLHGRVDVTAPPYIDALPLGNERYIIEGPLPAILLLPAVAIWHMDTNQTILSWLLCAIATAAGWELARRVGVPWRSRIVLTLFLLLGTDLFFCGVFGDVWYLAHVSAACFTLLALVELVGRKRAWLVMVWAACAFESRFSLVLAVPVYVYLLTTGVSPAVRRERLASIVVVASLVAGLWVFYNRARWGVWYDIGYVAWYHHDDAGEPFGSPFQLKYLPMQLYAFFALPPVVLPMWPYVVPSQAGLALEFTSPGLILAFFARRPVQLILALWVATILVAAPSFLYYVIGFTQFGMRHALDFEPFLFALMCLASVQGLRWWGAALCLFSSLVGAWGVWFWLTYYRNG